MLHHTEITGTNSLRHRESELVSELAREHYSKFIDLNNGINTLDQVKALINDIDFSNKSDSEKYSAIYDKYTKAFGENFLKADAVSYPVNDKNDIYSGIITQFKNDLKSVLGSTGNITKVLRGILYGDKSDSELRAMFIAQYSPGHNMTLRDFHEMTWSMAQVGLNTKLYEILFIATCFHDYIDVGITEHNSVILREDLLDKKLDLRHICRAYNAMFKVGFITIETGHLLRDLFNVSLDSRCFLRVDGVLYINWDKLIYQWIANYKYHMEKTRASHPLVKTA